MENLLLFVLWLLIYGLVAYVIVYVLLLVLGLFMPVPPKVAQILYVIAGLIILVWAVQSLPMISGPFPRR